MGHSKVVLDYKELKVIQERIITIFTGDEFPELVFCNPKWEMYCFERENLYDKDSFERFFEFTNKINGGSVILAPDSFCKTDVGKFVSSIALHGVEGFNHPVVIDFNRSENFQNINSLKEKYFYRSVDSLLFDTSERWGIYVNTNIDLMVLGFHPEIKDIVDKHYKNYEKRIKSIDLIMDDVATWAKKDRIEIVKDMIVDNYYKAFRNW